MSTPKNNKLQVIDLTAETFEFEQGEFRIAGFVANDGTEWFSAGIVCANLALEDTAKAVKPLPYRHKAITIISRNGVPVRNLMITKSGLFRLIFKSRKEEAEAYQDWVFDEVLPAIHEHGGYINPNASAEQITALQGELTRLKGQLDDAKQVNRWLAEKRGAGRFLERSLPARDRN